MYMYMYMYMYVYMYVYVCMYIYIYIYIKAAASRGGRRRTGPKSLSPTEAKSGSPIAVFRTKILHACGFDSVIVIYVYIYIYI